MNKITYHPVELHTHTYHSDASFSERELLLAAKDFGYEALFVTDHNTNSALDVIYGENLDKEIIPAFPGSEWTTFFGHMVILGNREMGDYTKARLDNIEECIAEIREREDDVILGIAHPYAIGNPICTGCHWDFHVDDYSKFDYMELANGDNPQNDYGNEIAYQKWAKLLYEGYKLAAVGGRDWHGVGSKDVITAINMLGINGEITETACLDAIRNQRTYITYGPIMDLEGLSLGESISESDIIKGEILLSKGDFSNYDHINIGVKNLKIINNEKVIFESPITINEPVTFDISPEKGYLRLEIIGDMKDLADYKLIISSPIYVN